MRRTTGKWHLPVLRSYGTNTGPILVIFAPFLLALVVVVFIVPATELFMELRAVEPLLDPRTEPFIEPARLSAFDVKPLFLLDIDDLLDFPLFFLEDFDDGIEPSWSRP